MLKCVGIVATCGSNRDCTVTYDFSCLRLHEQQEIVDPILSQAYKRSQGRYSMPLIQIPQELWEEIAIRKSNGESLRQLAKSYDVSHEAIRYVIKRGSNPSFTHNGTASSE